MRLVTVAVMVLGLAGCATLPGRSGRESIPRQDPADSAAEVTKAQINQLQRQAAMAEAEIRLLRRQLASLNVELERLTAELAGSRPAQREPAAPAPTVAPPIEPPVNDFDTSELEPVRVEPQVAVAPPAQPSAPAAAQPMPPSAESPTLGGPGGPVPTSGQSIYDRGYTLYHQGRFIDAESSFQRFLADYGSTELADNAQFWIGESRFARGDYMNAMLAFQEVLDAYPEGNKIADAMLKLGDCLVRLDNPAAGQQRFREVLARFPGSAAAAMAEERLGQPAN